MSNPDREPTYLQDVIAPKETEKAPEGFDLDREFGKGTTQRMREALKKEMLETDEDLFPGAVIGDAVFYRILFGPGFWKNAHEDEMRKDVKQRIREEYYQTRSEDGFQYLVLSGEFPWTSKKRAQEEETELKEEIKQYLTEFTQDDDDIKLSVATDYAVYYKTLFQKRCWTEEEHARMEKALRDKIQELLGRLEEITPEGYNYFVGMVAQAAAQYRLLRAHDIKFIPGKGIEVIDTPPQSYQQTPIPPMPEERKF